MNKNKLIFVGGIALGEIPTNGETAKNQVMLRRLEDFFDKVYIVDSFHWRRNPFLLIKMFWYFFVVRNAKVIISCHKSGMHVLNFLNRVRCQKNVYYWAIGSGLMEWIREGAVKMKACKFMQRIVVESTTMKKELEYMGLKNVSYMPNMKPIVKITPPLSGPSEIEKSKIKFVFLSRIIEEKGVFLILDSCRKLNERGYKDKYTVDFYGDISETPLFSNELKDFSNISYKGILDLTTMEGYEELSSYDVFLFPTYYPNEGFPGVLIDALMSGLPIIATDWKYNLDVVDNEYNGIVIPPEDAYALYAEMEKVISGVYDLKKMSSQCIESAPKYDVNNVITKEILEQFELL